MLLGYTGISLSFCLSVCLYKKNGNFVPQFLSIAAIVLKICRFTDVFKSCKTHFHSSTGSIIASILYPL